MKNYKEAVEVFSLLARSNNDLFPDLLSDEDLFCICVNIAWKLSGNKKSFTDLETTIYNLLTSQARSHIAYYLNEVYAIGDDKMPFEIYANIDFENMNETLKGIKGVKEAKIVY